MVYAPDDTLFNESYATAVERLGSRRWLDRQASAEARDAYAVFDGRRQQFRALTLSTRRELTAIYAKKEATSQDGQSLAALKIIAMQTFREKYTQLKASWGGYSGYDLWAAGANNASFGAQAAYDELVPDFEALFELEGRDWPRFYEAVKKLAGVAKDERHKALKALTSKNTETPNG